MDLSHFDALLMALGQAGQLLLLFVALRSRLYRTFPIFCLYILFSSITDIAFLTFLRHLQERPYWLAYFVDNVTEFLFQIGILIEVGRNVLNPVKRSLPRSSLIIFLGMTVVGMLLTLLLSWHSQPAQFYRWAIYFLNISFAVAILRLVIFAIIAGFSQLLGIGWKNHVLQIATGFLGYSIVVLLVELSHRLKGTQNGTRYHLYEQFRMIAWCMVLGYWSYTLSKVEAARKEFSPKMAGFLVSISQVARNNRTASARWYRK